MEADIAKFDYDIAFSRNFGWLSHEEQNTLKHKKVAIAGMGGVGGIHLVTLSRLGIQNFSLADFDHFDVANFNRQAGAFVSTIGKPKVHVMASIAKDINPNANIEVFDRGIEPGNIDSFLEGVDLYIDGLDFYVLDIRQKLFARAYEKNIPCTTVAPIGMGAALVNILPQKMSFDDYFGLSSVDTAAEKAILFSLGLAPKMLQSKYLIKPEALDLLSQKAPSTPMGCSLASGVVGTEALKILLNRGKVFPAPYSQQFDAYENKFKRVYCWGGYKNPLQKLKFKLAKKQFLV